MVEFFVNLGAFDRHIVTQPSKIGVRDVWDYAGHRPAEQVDGDVAFSHHPMTIHITFIVSPNKAINLLLVCQTAFVHS